MSGNFDFHDDLQKSTADIKKAHLNIKKIHNIQDEESLQLMQLQSEIIQLAESMGISVEEILETKTEELHSKNILQWDDDFFLKYSLPAIEAKVKEEIFKDPEILPALNQLDFAIVGISALIATILDFLVVKIPKDINYLKTYQQTGSNFTQLLKTLGIDQEGKLNLLEIQQEKKSSVIVISLTVFGMSIKLHKIELFNILLL